MALILPNGNLKTYGWEQGKFRGGRHIVVVLVVVVVVVFFFWVEKWVDL